MAGRSGFGNKMESLPFLGIWIALCFIVLAAAFTQGLTGFGFALVAAPLLLFIMDPRSVVVLNTIVPSLVCLLIVVQSRKQVKFKGMVPIAVASVFGVPLGAYVLLAISPDVLKLAIAALVVLFSIPLLLGQSHRFRRERPLSLVIGFISGFLSSSTSLSGPPVILFLVNQGWEREVMRASLSAYFLFGSVVALGWLSLAGVVTGEMVLTSAILLPASALGFAIGALVLPRVNAELYRRIAIIIVMGAGLVSIFSILGRLL